LEVISARVKKSIKKRRKKIRLWNLRVWVLIYGKIDAITSTVTLSEVLVLPFKMKNETLAEKYREILLYSDGLTTFEIFHDVSELSSRLRAKYSIRTPDAIQIAVGIIYGADTFLTNDSSLKRVIDIKIVVLEDFLEK
jgi:predicted nucleic acid-binding protein